MKIWLLQHWAPSQQQLNSCQLTILYNRLVKTVAGKLVYWFQTGSRFSERITGYRIYRTSCRHDPDYVDVDVLRCHECRRPPFPRNSSVVDNFWTFVLATVGCQLPPFTYVGQHAFRSKQCKPLKGGLLMLPERPCIDSCMAASYRPQLVGDRRPPCHPNNIETRASILCQSQRSYQTPLKLFDLYFAHSWRRHGWPRQQDRT